MAVDRDAARNQFLLEMYKQMWGNISRHIVIWQSISVLLGTFAVFALVEKRIISLDFASALIVLISAWLLAHVIDANYWYNRNLKIIANIERQFLTSDDLSLIHPYFGEGGRTTILDHLQIQGLLGGGVYLLVIVYHFSERIFPGVGGSWHTFEFQRTLPYLVSVVCIVWLRRQERKQKSTYEKLLIQSPGAPIHVADGKSS